MIERTFAEKIEISPRELESELWEMDSVQQTDFLLALSQRYSNEFAQVVMQYEYLKDSMASELSDAERVKIIDMLKTLVDYLEVESK